MAKTKKLADGAYRTDDGQYEIVAYGDGYLVNERRNHRYVTVATAKTVAAAEKELAKLTKSEEEAPEVEPSVVVEELVAPVEEQKDSE